MVRVLFFLLLVLFGVVQSSGDSSGWGPSNRTTAIYDINSYGAVSDGITDDSQALLSAWAAACTAEVESTVLIPKEQVFLFKQLVLSGPCKSRLTLQVDGQVQAPDSNSVSWNSGISSWITITNVNGLEVVGDGSLDGNGASWWSRSTSTSCNGNDTLCVMSPHAIEFHSVQNLVIRGLHVYNSPKMHIIFNGCRKVDAKWLRVMSPGNSPNTDGIHISRSKDVLLEYAFMGVGDDCISIVAGSSNVDISNVVCGPGHGISIGSLGGRSDSFDEVSKISISGAVLLGTTNGLRIKTYKNGKGAVNDISFTDIRLDAVSNPIIIDQDYCDSHKHTCAADAGVKEVSAVQVKNVVYDNIVGTFNDKSKGAIVFKCSGVAMCEGIYLGNIEIVQSSSRIPMEPFAKCTNAYGRAVGDFGPRNCLKS